MSSFGHNGVFFTFLALGFGVRVRTCHSNPNPTSGCIHVCHKDIGYLLLQPKLDIAHFNFVYTLECVRVRVSGVTNRPVK